MKKTLCFLLTFSLLGCSKPAARPAAEVAVASFKEGHGVNIPDAMRASLGLEISDVSEQKIVPRLVVPLHVVRGVDGLRTISSRSARVEAGGWITQQQAAGLQVGQSGQILLPDGGTAPAVIERLDKADAFALGEVEIVINTDAELETGAKVTASFDKPATGEVVSVPKSAIMTTAEGDFVYAVNDDYYIRTAVQTGASNGEAVEITEGLYAGDQIVSAQVLPLWMTELQTLRAGQSCCKGK